MKFAKFPKLNREFQALTKEITKYEMMDQIAYEGENQKLSKKELLN